MNITCSIYVLIAVSFCTASANESSAPREKGNLATRVKMNTRNIGVMERKILKSKVKLNEVVVEFSGTVMDVNENIADLAVRVQNTTEDVNGAVLEIDGKINDSNQVIADLGRQIKKTAEELNGDVLRLDEKITNADVEVEEKFEELNEEVADLGGQLNATTDDLNDIDEAVTGLEEKHDEAVTGLEEKIKLLEEALEVDLNDLDEAVTGLEEKHDGSVNGLEEKIKLLEEDLEVALKVEEIQFRGVASQSTTYSSNVANKCNDGIKSFDLCHTDTGDADIWWKLSFTNDVVINRIMVYSRGDNFPGSRVSILTTSGTIVFQHTFESEKKPVYVIAVPNIVGQYVKIDKTPTGYLLMREVAVFGRYD